MRTVELLTAADCAAWEKIALYLAAFDNPDAVDHNVGNAFGVLSRSFESSAIGDTLGIEDDDIGIGSDLQTALG